MTPALTRLIIPAYWALGAGIAIAVMEALSHLAQEPVWRVPFVTSIVLVMALPESPAAQPRALIGGHMLSCLAGWLTATLIGPGQTTSAVAVGLATLAMLATGTLHPPAGIDAFLMTASTSTHGGSSARVLIGTLMLAAFARLWREGERRLALHAGGNAQRGL